MLLLEWNIPEEIEGCPRGSSLETIHVPCEDDALEMLKHETVRPPSSDTLILVADRTDWGGTILCEVL